MMKYLIWLQGVLSAGSNKVPYLFERFSDAKSIYENKSSLKALGVLSDAEKARAEKLSLDYSQKIIDLCDKNGISTIGYFDKNYPDSFRHIKNPPLVLYIKGSLPDFNSLPSICIVGPRKVSDFGEKSAYSLAYRLSKGGMLVVSGGAKGADTAVHKGVLKAGGAPISILPCGILNGYLKENEPLRAVISEKGCLISEFSPNAPVMKQSFTVRNRLLAAIAHSTVVIEAGNGSGALITANYACEYGKELFVIPGNPTLPEYKGSNALLRDGARPLLDASDIFGEYIADFADKIDIEKAYESKTITKSSEKAKKDSKKLPLGLSKTAEMLYNNLNKQKFSADDLLSLGFSDEDVISSLTELEMEHLIKAVPGGFYEITEN